MIELESDELSRLRTENARLMALLARHGIAADEPEPATPRKPVLSLEGKVALFRSLFQGREDVFARRWFSNSTGKCGYQPVCSREWNREFCNKKKYKCAECPNREFQPLGYDDIYRHLEGKDSNGRDVVGVYAIFPDNTCRFLCCDFDDKSCEHGYQKDVKAYVYVCRDWGIPAYIERSRSGNDAHVWILFDEPVKARAARCLGNAILTEAMEREGRMSFKSYDRFFPNQDFMPAGGFGNLVALPLQGRARRARNSVFVDDDFVPYPDQWSYLQGMKKMSAAEVDMLVSRYDKAPLGELSKSNESAPWERPQPQPMTRAHFPGIISIIRSSGIYIPTECLSAKAINHLKRIAAFKNPEFYAKLGMRLPVYNLPRILSCSEMTDDYLMLPRGCEEAAVDFFKSNGVDVRIKDKTNPGKPIDVSFNGSLYEEQQRAVEALASHRCGTLYAITAFGKTVTAAALIARTKVNTLILVHTKALLEQWRKQFRIYLSTDFQPEVQPKGRGRRKEFQQFGALSSTENTLNGKIDIVLLQSCMCDNEVKPFVRDYGMVIVDECHHAPAVNFERVLREVNARYVYGLTATPIRKDGHQPIIFMQCAVIDQRIGWYGSVNLVGRSLADSNVIRMVTSEFANVLIDALGLLECMGTATSERFQTPPRQGYFVVTTELPEIQTVTIWTPCCGRMTIICGVELNTKYQVYTEVYMYNLVLYPAKNVWSEREIIPYFAPSTTRNAFDGRRRNRVDDMRRLLIIL